MPERSLTPTSHLVLGFVDILGPCTVYDIKQMVNISVGQFWSFPHSQLYSEPAKLVEDGLLAEEQEQTGRRRRVLSLTRSGRKALKDWKATPTDHKTELRDQGLLQLFFADTSNTAAIKELAEARKAHHEERIADLKALRETVEAETAEVAGPAQLRMMDLGVAFEKAAVRFWADIIKNPPKG